MNILQVYLEDWKASRRGEKRVAPNSATGRVYARVDAKPKPSGYAASAKPKAALHRRVYRAATDTWETLPAVPVQIEVKNG